MAIEWQRESYPLRLNDFCWIKNPEVQCVSQKCKILEGFLFGFQWKNLVDHKLNDLCIKQKQFLGATLQKRCQEKFGKFRREHLCWSLQTCNFIKKWHNCSPANLVKYFRTLFLFLWIPASDQRMKLLKLLGKLPKLPVSTFF